MAEKQFGIAIRFMQGFTWDPHPGDSLWDRAFNLAIRDEREDVDFAEKIADALAFLKSRIH